MDRFVLTETVRHEGTDYRGRYASIVLEPAPGRDWVWRINGMDVPITPAIMESRPRRIALSHGGQSFNEFEYIGILRAAGLRGVRVSLGGTHEWPPYDGRSFALWQAVMPHARAYGELRPFYPHQVECRAGGERSTHYVGERNSFLRLVGHINFRGLGEHDFAYEHKTSDLRDLVRARTLGWPPRIKPWLQLADMLNLWPHYKNIVWPGDEPPARVLQETGRHRMLDMLGILNFVAPAEHYLSGLLYSRKGSHETDLMLLKALVPAGNVVPLRRPSAA